MHKFNRCIHLSDGELQICTFIMYNDHTYVCQRSTAKMKNQTRNVAFDGKPPIRLMLISKQYEK